MDLAAELSGFAPEASLFGDLRRKPRAATGPQRAGKRGRVDRSRPTSSRYASRSDDADDDDDEEEREPAEATAVKAGAKMSDDDDDDDDEPEFSRDDACSDGDDAGSPQGFADGMDATMTAAKRSKSGSAGTFGAMGLSDRVLSGIRKMGYKLPTPIQRRTLPLTLAGRDVVAMARTGSGKTAAFLVPILERLGSHAPSSPGPRAVVLSPTRELAMQTFKFARSLGRETDLRCAVLVGGDALEAQFEALATSPDILIATPGRLMHLLAEVNDMTLDRVELLVFDEADRLFEMGFAEQLHAILTKCPATRQTLLFSATLPSMLVQFARAGLRDPELLRLDVETKVSDQLRMAFLCMRTEERDAALVWVLRELLPESQQALVFVSTRHHVELVTALLRKASVSADGIYGQLDADARRNGMGRFRSRRIRVLVVTDVAARGIDLPLLDNVINYSFPDRPKLFVHRCGRVARMGRSGCAFLFVTPPDEAYMCDIFRFLNRPTASSRAEAERLLREKRLAEGDASDLLHDDDHQQQHPDADARSYTLADMTPDDVHYGRLPRSILLPHVESVQRWDREDLELAKLRQVAKNGTLKYTKTQADASRHGILAAKSLSHDAVHPLAIAASGSDVVDAESAVNTLAAFRPPQTIFEYELARRGNAKLESAARAMVLIRNRHRDTIDRTRAILLKKAQAADASHEAAEGTDVEGEDGPGSAAPDDLPSGVTALPSTSGPRMSVAERRRQRKKRQRHEDDASGEDSDADDARSVRTAALGTAALSKRALADRLVSSAASLASKSGRQMTSGSLGTFRSSAGGGYIAATAGEAARATEEAMDVHQGMLGAAALEAHSLDLVADERRNNNEKRRQFFWDPTKRRYVQVTPDEALERIGAKRLKTSKEGLVRRSDGEEHGEAYRKWMKKSKKRVGAELDEAIVAKAVADAGSGPSAFAGMSAAGAPIVLTSADYRGNKGRGGRPRQEAIAASLGTTAADARAAGRELYHRQRVFDHHDDDDDGDGDDGGDESAGASRRDGDGDGDNQGRGERMSRKDSAQKKSPGSGKSAVRRGTTSGAAPARELRTEDEIRKLRKKANLNKIRNMPKNERRKVYQTMKKEVLAKRSRKMGGKAPPRSFKVRHGSESRR